MRCDTFRDALLEAAAGARELNETVKDHVEECPQCRAMLRQEQTLFVAIDGALRVRMEEEPRIDFLADVRARIAQEPEPSMFMSPRWALAAAAVAVALVAMAVPWARLRRTPVAVGGSRVSTIRIPVEPKFAESTRPEIRHGPSPRLLKKQAVARHTDREPEVLVPPDERVALAKFVTHLKQRDEVARALASPQVDENGELSEITPLEIARLQLKRLTWESWMPGDDRQGEEER